MGILFMWISNVGPIQCRLFEEKLVKALKNFWSFSLSRRLDSTSLYHQSDNFVTNFKCGRSFQRQALIAIGC